MAYIGFLIHLWITPFMLRLHPAGYAQHERTSKPARPERSEAKSKGEQGVFTTHLKRDPYSSSQVDFPQQEEESTKEERGEEAKGQRRLFEVFTFRLGVRGVPAQCCPTGPSEVYYTNTPEEAAELHRTKAKSRGWHEIREVSEPESQWWFLDYESIDLPRNDYECITVVRLYRQR